MRKAEREKPRLDTFWIIGKAYLIRTVTMIDTGVLVSIDEHEIVLKEAAWIADTGRFNETLKSLNFKEVEPFPSGLVAVGRGSVVDAVQIAAAPRSVK
jgi:hypothetical protein